MVAMAERLLVDGNAALLNLRRFKALGWLTSRIKGSLIGAVEKLCKRVWGGGGVGCLPLACRRFEFQMCNLRPPVQLHIITEQKVLAVSPLRQYRDLFRVVSSLPSPHKPLRKCPRSGTPPSASPRQRGSATLRTTYSSSATR